jgi:hypothetical protein
MGSSNSKPRVSNQDQQQQQGKAAELSAMVLTNHYYYCADNSPLLLIGNSNSSPQTILPTSLYDRLPLQNPSVVEYLMGTHVGHGLLHDYMTPGMWITAGNSGGVVRVSLPPNRWTQPPHQSPSTSSQNDSNSCTDCPQQQESQQNSSGKLSVAVTPHLPAETGPRLELQTGGTIMRLLARQPFLVDKNDFCRGMVVGNLNSDGTGYIGGQLGLSYSYGPPPATPQQDEESSKEPPPMLFDWEKQEAYYVDVEPPRKENVDSSTWKQIQVQIGSWMSLQQTLFQTHYSREKNQQLQPQSQDDVYGYMAMSMLGSTCTTAVESKWNRTTNELQTKKFLSLQLMGGNNETNTSSSPPTGASSSPMWLTMTSTPQSSTINVSQIITLDRHFSILKNKNNTTSDENDNKSNNCRIRNHTLGWSFQVEQPNGNQNNRILNMDHAILSAGVAWQCHPGMAIKMTVIRDPQQQQQSLYQCTMGILLKIPRVTCSILNRYDFAKQQYSWVGLGLELDATSTGTTNADADTGASASSPPII